MPDELIYPHDANGNSAAACARLARIALIYGWCLVRYGLTVDWRRALAVLIGFLAAFLIAKRARLTRLARWMPGWSGFSRMGMTDAPVYATSERLADHRNARETVELQGRTRLWPSGFLSWHGAFFRHSGTEGIGGSI